MKLKKLAAIIVLATVSPLTLASTADGPYVGLGMGFYNGDTTVKAGAASLTFGSDKHEVGGDVFAGYKWNLGGGSMATEVSYGSNYGKVTAASYGGEAATTQLKNGVAVSILPGYALSKETTAFVRIGYVRVKGEANVSGTVNSSTSENFNGVMYGVGIDHAVSQNVALRAEYKVLDNLSKTVNGVTWEPRGTGLNFAIRYAF